MPTIVTRMLDASIDDLELYMQDINVVERELSESTKHKSAAVASYNTEPCTLGRLVISTIGIDFDVVVWRVASDCELLGS
ncbi:hypothetical protein V6N11_044200 [Hibiscus sabdariffa]|uniref:Uncharacterized protein n=1 Tax=Hibiscus sabdariffa TaxID=183260 RepID=A0ABR2REV5_9ROSI